MNDENLVAKLKPVVVKIQPTLGICECGNKTYRKCCNCKTSICIICESEKKHQCMVVQEKNQPLNNEVLIQ